MHLFLRLLGNDEPAVRRAVAVLRTLHATRHALAHCAALALIAVALVVNALGLAIVLGAAR